MVSFVSANSSVSDLLSAECPPKFKSVLLGHFLRTGSLQRQIRTNVRGFCIQEHLFVWWQPIAELHILPLAFLDYMFLQLYNLQ
jgi:hypothetical protein